MPSFDIVSEVDEVELRNAVENSRRELSGRFYGCRREVGS